MTDAAAAAGRDVIAARAIEQVARAVTGEVFGVPASGVRVDLRDDGGRLDLDVRTPVRVVPLSRVRTDPGALGRSGGPLVARAEEGRLRIRDRVGELTGSTVARVALRFTEALVQQERRVR